MFTGASLPTLQRRKRRLNEEEDAQAELAIRHTYQSFSKAFSKVGPHHRTMTAARQRRTSGTSAYPDSGVAQSSLMRLQQATSCIRRSASPAKSTKDRPPFLRRSASPSPLPKKPKLLTDPSLGGHLGDQFERLEASPPAPVSPQTYSRSTSTFRADTASVSTSSATLPQAASEKQGEPSSNKTETGDVIIRDHIEPLHPILHANQVSRRCYGCLMSPRGKAKKDKKHPQDVARQFLDCSRCTMVIWCSVVSAELGIPHWTIICSPHLTLLCLLLTDSHVGEDIELATILRRASWLTLR